MPIQKGQNMKTIFINHLLILLIFTDMARAENVLASLEKQARSENPKFAGFSTTEGKKLFYLVRTKSNGDTASCTTCHSQDPKNNGKTRANKIIEPLAPVANSQRFTDLKQVEKWFSRNCKDVLERLCTNEEKGNFAKFMMSIK
jgi:hypothetical protein